MAVVAVLAECGQFGREAESILSSFYFHFKTFTIESIASWYLYIAAFLFTQYNRYKTTFKPAIVRIQHNILITISIIMFRLSGHLGMSFPVLSLQETA